MRFTFTSSDSSVRVEITNRVNCCYDRLIGGNVQILDSSMQTLGEQQVTGSEGTISSAGGVGNWTFGLGCAVAFEGIELTQGNDLELLFYAVKRQCACWKKIRVTFGFKALTIAQLTYQLMYDHSTNVTCAF